MNLLSTSDLKNKTVLIYINIDINIIDGKVSDDTMLQHLLPSINHLVSNNNKIVLISHMGEANGSQNDELSMMPIRFELSRLLQKTVKFVLPLNPTNSLKYLRAGDVLLIENLGFFAESFDNDPKVLAKFYSVLTDICDVFVDESFGNNKYTHVIEYLKSKFKESYLGCNFEKEITFAKNFFEKANSPKIAILGGQLNKQKLDFMVRCKNKFDNFLVGGVIGSELIKKLNGRKSMTEFDDHLEQICELIKDNTIKITLPVDHLGVNQKNEVVELKTQNFDEKFTPKDIGPVTLVLFREIIETAETILWSGPMGTFEDEKFNTGTEAIGEYIALSAPRKALKVATGSKTIRAISELKIKHKRFSYISAGEVFFLDILGR
jgi:phosphoglycerate kinase